MIMIGNLYLYMFIDFRLPNDFNLQSVTSPCILKQKVILYYIHSSSIRIYISRYNCLYLRFQHIRSSLPSLMYYLSNDLCFHQTIFTGKVWFFILLFIFWRNSEKTYHANLHILHATKTIWYPICANISKLEI